MRKILFGVMITLLILATFRYCMDQKVEQVALKEHSGLLQEQINNVGKLVVSEGHFSEVFTYKKSKAVFADFLDAEKHAVVIVNADVTVSYDLSKIVFKIDELSKTLHILSLPQEDIKISPNLEYYDIQEDFLNQFEAKDYNEINNAVRQSLTNKINASSLKTNAKNRLISELAKFFILTKSLGWTLKYNNQIMTSPELWKSTGVKL